MYYSVGGGVAAARLLSSVRALDSATFRCRALPARCHGAQEVSSAEWVAKEEPNGMLGRLSANLLLREWKQNQKRRRERVNLHTKKCKQKEKEEQRDNRRKWTTERLKKLTCRKCRD